MSDAQLIERGDVELIVVDDMETAARTCAERIVAAVRAGMHIVLTGGGTPARAYEIASELERDWSGADLWFGDDRAVAPEDERSNYGMVERTLLRRLERGPRSVHRIQGELGAAAAADAYDAELAGVRFDLLLLGLGPDGHVASLFPSAPTLGVTDRRALAAEAGFEPWVERVTLTLPVLRSAREILFLVTGEEKADAAARAFGGAPDWETPGSLVRAADGPTRAILDRAAAARLI